MVDYASAYEAQDDQDHGAQLEDRAPGLVALHDLREGLRLRVEPAGTRAAEELRVHSRGTENVT